MLIWMGLCRGLVKLAVQPNLWPTASRFIPNHWWTYPPYLPVPPKKYVQFRLQTMYGNDIPPSGELADDMIRFLTWARRYNG